MRVYGPVPSRRFGLSLGVDVLVPKTCTYDCIYCQVGPTDNLICDPAEIVSFDEIITDVEQALRDEPRPDVISLAGSGEPTLYSRLGELIDALHSIAKLPVLLITNGSLLWRDDVLAASRKADILAPSLDAANAETYSRINGPHPAIPFERMLEGLEVACATHPGEVRLEIMLVRDINDDDSQLAAMAEITKRIRCHRIDINTPVRPPVPERGALPCSENVLAKAMALFGPKARPIGTFVPRLVQIGSGPATFTDRDKDIRETLLRRPSTARDLAMSLGLTSEDVTASLSRLERGGLIESRASGGETYYHARSTGRAGTVDSHDR